MYLLRVVTGTSAIPVSYVCLHGIWSKPWKRISIPVFFVFGLATILAFSACMITITYLNNQLTTDYIENPATGDIYVFEDKEEQSEYRFYLCKVVHVFEDSVYMAPNVYVYDLVPGQMIEDDAFIDTYYVIDRIELQRLYQSGGICNVRRFYTEESGFDRMLHVEFETP